MNNFIKFNENNNFLSPINSILNSYATKEDFEYSMMLISKISNPLERLEIFNEFMTQIFIKVSQGTVNDDLEHIIYKEDVSEPLADFLKTFGNNWDKIKTSIPPNKQELFENAITYSRNNIKFQALKDTSFKLSKEKRINLINSLDLDDQKEYFLSNEQINNYKFTSDDICNILSNFSHDKRKLNYLTKSLEEIHLGKKQILQIAYSLNFDSNIAKFLKPANVNFFKFSSSDCTNIINSIKKDNFRIQELEKILSSQNNNNLSAEQICNIICSFNEDKSKLKYLKIAELYRLFPDVSSKEIKRFATHITASLQEDKNKLKFLTPQKADEFGFRNYNIAYIATTLADDKNKSKIMEDGKTLKLNSKNFARIVSSFQKDSDKIDYINSLPKNENHKSEKARIVSSLKSLSSIEKYLNDPDIVPYKNAILLGMFSDQKTVSKSNFDRICKMADIDPNELHSLSIPVLPSKMTIGVELETIGLNESGNASTDLFKEFRSIFGNFKAQTDRSLSGYNNHSGVEIVSPILMNHNLENLNLVSKLLQKNNLGTNETCGAHIHIGADYLDSIEAWKNLCEIWGNNEDLMYKITNHHGSGMRDNVNEFARPISPKIAKSMKNGSISIKSEKDLDNFVQQLQLLQNDRNSDFSHICRFNPNIDPNEYNFQKYYGLNFKNLNSINKNTIEFRLPNGTINPQTLMNNIRLFSKIVSVSKELGEIEYSLKNGISLTDRQKNLFNARNMLINKSNGTEQERLDALLNLLFNSDLESQNIYIKRYKDFPKESLYDVKFDKFDYRNWYEDYKLNIPHFLDYVTNDKQKERT